MLWYWVLGLAAGAVKVALQGHGSFFPTVWTRGGFGRRVSLTTRLGMPTSEGAGAGCLMTVLVCLWSADLADVREDVEELERGCCVYSMGGCEVGITLLRPRIAASCNPSALGTLEP